MATRTTKERLVRFITDSRTEFTLRWTVLLAVCYAVFFYPPGNSPSWIDWSMPVQLASGGNVGFYNVGFHLFFGIGAAVSMCVAGILLSIIFGMLQDDHLGAAYVVLLTILTTITIPVIGKVGVLNNGTSLTVLLISIFTEVFYGPILNLRSVLPNVKSIFTQVIIGNAVPALIYCAFSISLYLIPPWHSGRRQSQDLVASVLEGMAQSLVAASTRLDDNPKAIREISRTLFQETNYAGLQIPVTLYGEFGLYEFNPVARDVPDRLGTSLDEFVLFVCCALYMLTSDSVIEELEDESVQEAVAAYLLVVSAYVKSIAGELKPSMQDDVVAMERDALKRAGEKLRLATETSAPLVWAILRHFCLGSGQISHSSAVRTTATHEGSVGYVAKCVEDTRRDFTDPFGYGRILFRMTFVEQLLVLLRSWCLGALKLAKGVSNSRDESHRWTRDRYFRRSVQWIVGTWGLYAMATWWDSYRTLLGSSSTGQWTMVAFYVCFRATAEETVNAAILRSIGHLIGALLSWGINVAATTNGARMASHLTINVVATWFIPPPFFSPSSFPFKLDLMLAGLVEGALTTYHLTSVLVFSTDIESAAKARALSQCIGSAAAAVISVLIFPLFARVEAPTALKTFQEESKAMLMSSTQEKVVHEQVENLLQARRDWNAAMEAKGWFGSLLDALNILSSSLVEAQNVSDELTRAALASYALEGFLRRARRIDSVERSTLRECLSRGDFKQALGGIRDLVSVEKDDAVARQELATMFVLLEFLCICLSYHESDFPATAEP